MSENQDWIYRALEQFKQKKLERMTLPFILLLLLLSCAELGREVAVVRGRGIGILAGLLSVLGFAAVFVLFYKTQGPPQVWPWQAQSQEVQKPPEALES